MTAVLAEPAAAPVRRRVDPLLAAAWVVFGVVLGVLVARAWRNPPYSVDSWSYYELSRHLGTDFFRITTWRSFQGTEPYSSSFGPLWPVAVRVVATVTGTTVLAGFVGAVGCCVGTALAVTGYARRVGLPLVLGPLVAFGLLAFGPYTDEMLAGRSIPAALLLTAVLLWVSAAATGRRAAAAGAVGAALVLTRTDLLLALVLFGGLLLVTRRLRLPAVAAFAVVLLPWVLWSLAHFGTALASDNALIATSVARAHSSYVLDPATTPTVADDPLSWLGRVAGNAGPVTASWWAAISVPLLVALVAGLGFARQRPPVLALLLLPCVFVQTAVAQLTTGYLDQRYLSGVVLLALIVAIGGITRRWIAGGLGVLLAVGALGADLPVAPPDSLGGGRVEADLRRCTDPSSTVLTLSLAAARHGALTGHPAGILPKNLPGLTPAQVGAWLDRYDIRQYYETPDPVLRNTWIRTRRALTSAARLIPNPCARHGTLYRIVRTRIDAG